MKVKTLSEAERWTVPILAANPSGNSTRVCVCGWPEDENAIRPSIHAVHYETAPGSK